ncbi:MAG: hypothetical protein GY694_10060 [Gammaproteobacteria bacterium]|nr:hypothetical protein [Gammaproteobacteria bacterium]
MDMEYQNTGDKPIKKTRWSRRVSTAMLFEFEKAANEQGISPQNFEDTRGVPRKTLEYWIDRKQSIDAPQAVVNFFESPEGLECLHRIVLAAQFIITLLGPSGIRLVCMFLMLSGLNRFVASSYGSQRKAIIAMEEAVGDFGKEERKRLSDIMAKIRKNLGKSMAVKWIIICQDETFHPEICLVVMEPGSCFIFAEQYSDDRKSDTWVKVVKESTKDLPIKIIQCTTDEAAALIKQAREGHNAHHGSDTFHVQYEISKGTSFPLASALRNAMKSLDKAKEKTKKAEEIAKIFRKDKNSSERLPRYVERPLKYAKENEEDARLRVEEARKNKEKMREEIRGISECYHPFDLETGSPRDATQVGNDLEEHFEKINDISEKASLSQKCFEHIKKAYRVVPNMIATISFYHASIFNRVEAAGLPMEVEQAICSYWIPARYIELVSSKAKGAECRKKLKENVKNLLDSGPDRIALLSGLEENDKAIVDALVEECAQLFQRSSSCVEGRNGHLDLFHHGQHRLPNRKLRALTAVSNYFKLRIDKTTAAERLFGAPPRNMFEWLIERLEYPSRPAKPRPKKKAA